MYNVSIEMYVFVVKGGLTMQDDGIRTESNIPEQAEKAAGMGYRIGSLLYGGEGRERKGPLMAILKLIGERMLKRYGDKQQQELIQQIQEVRRNGSYTKEQKASMIATLEKGINNIEGHKTLDMGGRETVKLPEGAGEMTLGAPEPQDVVFQARGLLEQDFNRQHEVLQKSDLTDAQKKEIADAKTKFDTANGQVKEIQAQMKGADRYARKGMTEQASKQVEVMRGAQRSLTDIAKKLNINLAQRLA